MELTLSALQQNHMANPVIVVWDGAEALDDLYREGQFAQRKEGNPAVILVDLKVPKVDGLEVLRRIKSDERLQSIPVVILTSSREERDLVEGYRLGVNAYVVKPIHLDEFVEAVSRLGVFWALVNELPGQGGVGDA